MLVAHRRQARENIGEIFLRIDAVTAAALDEGVNDGAAPTRVRVADKEPAAFSDRGWSHVLDEVIVEFDDPIALVFLRPCKVWKFIRNRSS